jgi:hypothetical protein
VGGRDREMSWIWMGFWILEFSWVGMVMFS